MDFKAGDVVIILPGFNRTPNTMDVVEAYDPETKIVTLNDGNLYFTFKLIHAIGLSKLERIIYGVENERN